MWPRRAVMVAVLATALAGGPAAAAVLTGSVRAVGAQHLLAPPSTTSPETLSFFVPDGTKVKKGDPVVRVDASQSSSQVESLRDNMALTRATNAKKLAALKLKVIDARLAEVKANAALATAKVDADIPGSVITALDYDKYQGTWKSAKRDAALKKADVKTAEAAVRRQQEDGALELKKLQLQLAFFQAQVKSATVDAQQDGVVVHGFQTLSINGSKTGRFHEGSMTLPGAEVGKVVGQGRHWSVRAWALQPDRRGLKVGQMVRLHFDALPGVDIGGRIKSISATTEPRPAWGSGHYYRVDIAVDKQAGELALLPGMSVRVQTDAGHDRKPPTSHPQPPATLHASGTVIAQRSWTLTAPQIPGLWQMNITRMAADGSQVTKGQPLVTFAAGRLAQELPSDRSELAEKQTARKQLRLKLADDKRTAELAVAKAKADADKARRKARQPKQYIAAVAYQKLVIDRDSAKKVLQLTRRRARVARSSRKAQQAEADAQVAQLQSKVKRKMQAMAKLTVPAPRDGLFLHRIKRDGSKVDNGDQVFFGTEVGTMPDMGSLAVRASLPERELRLVHVGQSAQVVLSGGSSRTLDGHVASIGNNVHSRSGSQPIPVVTLIIELDDKQAEVKPGRSATVNLSPTAGASS